MAKAEFFVRGMSCGGCVRKVKEKVGAKNGVEQVEVDLETGKVSVQFDCCKMNMEQLEKIVDAAGFQVVK